MSTFFKHHPANPEQHSDEHPLLPLHEHELNTNEGSEFLDDAIRMHEQPLMRIEESISAGSPENLL